MAQRFALHVLLVAVVPYLLGLMASSKVIPADYFRQPIESLLDSMHHRKPERRTMGATEEEDSMVNPEGCLKVFDQMLELDKKGDPFERVNFVIHRNGEAESCSGESQRNAPSRLEALRSTILSRSGCPNLVDDKLQFESLLTGALANVLLPKSTCPSQDEDYDYAPDFPQFLDFCYMGEDRTPILRDHDDLVPVPGWPGYLPCRFHTREGVRISSWKQLTELARNAKDNAKEEATKEMCIAPKGDQEELNAAAELHLYAVPAGRVFMFSPSYVGERFDLPHVQANGMPVYLEVLSVEPRVFDVYNFFSKEESDDIVKRALAEKSESHRIKRSSTGASGYNINRRRTSESGFDTNGKTAHKVKKRCLQVLGFDKYIEGHTDGLQVLRYNKTTAYTAHLDWIDDYGRQQVHNYDSQGVGGNRYATILLYMSDIGEHDGGETVFVEGWPDDVADEDRKDFKTALRELRESGDAKLLAKNSWEEELVAKCRSRLAVRPHSARAVLFYSEHPNGEPDQASMHAGCPVLNGTKWAANLWVWNTPREGFPGSPVNEDVVEKNRKQGKAPAPTPGQLTATFRNSGKAYPKAALHYQDTFWSKLNADGDDVGVNTYEGHKWNVQVDGEVVQTWIIGDEKEQWFTL